MRSFVQRKLPFTNGGLREVHCVASLKPFVNFGTAADAGIYKNLSFGDRQVPKEPQKTATASNAVFLEKFVSLYEKPK